MTQMPLISELIIKSFTYVASALVEFFAKVFRFLLALPSNFLKLKIAVDRIIRDAMKASSTKKVLLLVFFGIGLRLIVKWRVDRLKKDSNRQTASKDVNPNTIISEAIDFGQLGKEYQVKSIEQRDTFLPVFNSAEEQSFYIDFDNISREINFRAQTQTEQQADNVFFGMMETYRRIHIGHLRELAEEKHLEKQQQRFEQSSWEVNDPVEICKD